MGNYLPKHLAGDKISLVATAAITGGRLVGATGAHAAADSKIVIGVAGHDAASGTSVVVFHGGVQYPLAAADIAAGALVKAAADGKVTTYTAGTDDAEELVGVALEAFLADATGPVKFFR